jgi:putative FmdB family regulatory protein
VPLYEYRCLPNEHRFEVRQSMSEDPVTICPECGGPVRRVIHPVGLVFKGSGFYVTDSRKGTSESSSPSSGSGSGEKKAPETKADKTEKKSESTSSGDS